MSVRNFFATTAILILLAAASARLQGQVHSSSSYMYLLGEKNTLEHLEFLTSPQIAGRGAGTAQAKEVADYIAEAFASYGLLPLNSINFYQPFELPPPRPSGKRSGGMDAPQGVRKGQQGFNVIGYAPSRNKDAQYIVVGAHFDHIGIHGEKYYPGADDNASGVAGMLEIAKAFGKRFVERNDLNHHIVFVAFDGNNYNLSGSRAFLQKKGIPPHKIACMLNLDQMGSTLTPVGEYTEYLQVLGADKLPPWQKEQLDFVNDYFGLGLLIDYTYYGSRQFYDIFYRLSDQQSFTAAGVPALLFTSGITRHTNKESDTVATLSLDVLQRRIELIYRFLWLID
ncbi:MAG: M28 family peptidase [Bacteroidales bacterium]|nr:M28 family peptidase [Bacteroidales bacterium]